MLGLKDGIEHYTWNYREADPQGAPVDARGDERRRFVRDRARVIVDTVAGSASGLVGVVGADFIEISTAVGSSVAVPMAAITRVRAAG